MLSYASSPLVQGLRWQTLARAENLVVMTDLDGTLVEFAPTAEEATPDSGAVQLLRELIECGVRVIIVSGRPRELVEPLRALVPGAWWVAEHGSWRWEADLVERPQAAAHELDELLATLRAALVDSMRIERKTLSLCVHWRGVCPALREQAIGAIETICDEWLEEHPGFERLAGVEVLEIRERDVHKGTAVTWARQRLGRVRIIAIGDDTTDEDMFAELDEGDACVSVGPRAIQADAHAPDVDAAHAFLRWVAETRNGRELPLPITPTPSSPDRKRYRLLVMSNRTPAATQGRSREVGGLVSALEPALQNEHGIWLGWSGQERDHDSRVVIDTSEQLARARFDMQATVHEQFYLGFCNRVLWPLFHGFAERVRCGLGDWEAYVAANERYARHAIQLAHRRAAIWVHDYHLLMTAQQLRALGHEGPIGLFLHIPFPAPQLLERIPWGRTLVDAMCDFAVVGFQTEQFAENFRVAARSRHLRGRPLPDVAVLPATIDPAPFRAATPESPDVAGLRSALGNQRLLLGVDRLDYSKGIPERLRAYERLLEQYPDWRRHVSLLQVSVPSRAEIPDYKELRHEVEGMVGRINGRFGDTDWVPVRYLYRSYDRDVLAQLYRLADVALVTPLQDGMNLVAKEFVAAQDVARPGVLVLSQYAGAAETLSSAILTNPCHPDGLAADIDTALRLPAAERIEHHRRLLAALEREGDARAWATRFLNRLAPRRLHSV